MSERGRAAEARFPASLLCLGLPAPLRRPSGLSARPLAAPGRRASDVGRGCPPLASGRAPESRDSRTGGLGWEPRRSQVSPFGPPSLTDGETEAGTLASSQRLREGRRAPGGGTLCPCCLGGSWWLRSRKSSPASLMACSAFFFQFPWCSGEDGFALLCRCSWKVCPVETGTSPSFIITVGGGGESPSRE